MQPRPRQPSSMQVYSSGVITAWGTRCRLPLKKRPHQKQCGSLLQGAQLLGH